MHSIHDHSELATHLFTLFIRCPFRMAEKECPFAEIRAMESLELKYRLAEQMAGLPDFSEDFCKTHEACYRNRMRRVVSACYENSATGAEHHGNPRIYNLNTAPISA